MLKEVRGKICPICGGSVVRRGRRFECDWDGPVRAVKDPAELLDDAAGELEALLYLNELK
jgi:hypothetical protein